MIKIENIKTDYDYNICTIQILEKYRLLMPKSYKNSFNWFKISSIKEIIIFINLI